VFRVVGILSCPADIFKEIMGTTLAKSRKRTSAAKAVFSCWSLTAGLEAGPLQNNCWIFPQPDALSALVLRRFVACFALGRNAETAASGVAS